ncbi:Upstream activation factor subunit spp27 [Bienertia sinuspersici]
MVSESELVNRLREILKTSDLNTTSAGAVRRQLESELGVQLSDRKKFISEQIDLILHSDDINGEQEGDDDVDGNDEQEEDEEQEDEDEVVKDEDEDEEEVSDEDEEKAEVEASKNKKRKSTGFTRLCSLSPQLQEFVGASEMARTEVVKKLWAYIREKDLQDPTNRRNIKCDSTLHSIFRVNTINMFQMNKSLSDHIWPLESPSQQPQLLQDSSPRSPPPEKKQKRQKVQDTEKPKRKQKQKKGGLTGFLIPLQLSEPFVKFLGTGETTLSRSDAVKRIWDYIKQNQLQDPSDKRRILCDEKLKELFNVEFFNGFSVTKLLTAHLTKVEQ